MKLSITLEPVLKPAQKITSRRIQSTMDFDKFVHILAENLLRLFQQGRTIPIKIYRCLILAVRGFKEENTALRASALTFYSLLSIVPVMAMAFGIAKGFGFEKLLEKELLNGLTGQQEIAFKIIDFSKKLLSETRGGVMATLGIILLIWSVIKMLNHMEGAFNRVWHIKKGRPFIRKLSDYIALFFTAPILVLFAGSVTVYIKTRLNIMLSDEKHFYILDAAIPLLLKLLPLITMCGLFIFLYLFIPYRQMNIKASLAGGIITGIIYQAGQMLYINFQVGVSHYNAIYGSFAALPLFLTWLQTSWLVVLLGAHFSYAWEHTEILEKSRADYGSISFKMKKIIALGITLICVKRFSEEDTPPTDEEISMSLDIPLALVITILDDLKKCGVLSEVNASSGTAWQPARDIYQLSVSSVIHAIEEHGKTQISVSGTMEFEALIEAVESLAASGNTTTGTRLLKDI